MPIELKMPALSPTMEEGTLAKWLVKEGDEVKSGDILAEIETDKATMEFEAVDEGKIAKILVPEGSDGVKVGAPIAIMAGEGEDASAAARRAEGRDGPRRRAPRRRPSPRPTNAGARRKLPVERLQLPPQPAAPPRARANGSRPRRSPVGSPQAKNIDLSPLKGSGPGGRIVRADIDGRRQGAPAAAPAGAPRRRGRRHASVMPGPIEQAIPHEAVKLTNIRKTIARRLTEAKQQIPHIYLTVDIQLDPCSSCGPSSTRVSKAAASSSASTTC